MWQRKQPPRAQSIALTAPFAYSARPARARIGRPFSCLVLLLGVLLGLLVGALSTLFYISSAHDVPAPASQSASGEAAIVVQVGSTYLSQLVGKEVGQAGIPGGLKNIQVTLAHNAPITIGGDDQVSFLGFAVTKHATIQLQPVIRSCQLQVSITHADFSGIPVTSFVSSFEKQINQQLSNSSNGSSLPPGFIYCVTNVRTETNGIYVTYTAKPS